MLALRRSGKRPEEAIVVSLVEDCIPASCEAVIVSPELGVIYDWSWIADLDMWLIVTARTDGDLLSGLIKAIREYRPRSMKLWLADRRHGYHVHFTIAGDTWKRPQSEWKWAIEMVPLCSLLAIDAKRYFLDTGYRAAPVAPTATVTPAEDSEW